MFNPSSHIIAGFYIALIIVRRLSARVPVVYDNQYGKAFRVNGRIVMHRLPWRFSPR
jgi:hypothetical protein